MKIINMDFLFVAIVFFTAAGLCSILLSGIGRVRFSTTKKQIREKRDYKKNIPEEQINKKNIQEEQIHKKNIPEEQIHKKNIHREIIFWMFAGAFSVVGMLCSLIGGMRLEDLMLPLLGLLWINLFSQIKIGRKKLRGNE